jgi:hypothetical protein
VWPTTFGIQDTLRCRRVSAHIRAIIACRAFRLRRQDRDDRQIASNAPDVRQTLASMRHPIGRTIAEREATARRSLGCRQGFYLKQPAASATPRKGTPPLLLGLVIESAYSECEGRGSNPYLRFGRVESAGISQKPRLAASASCASWVIYAKNACDWPMKRPMAVRNRSAPMAAL